MIDTSTDFGRRVERRLRDEKIGWLTTVDADGTPQPVPVWFLWDGGDSVLLYSQVAKPKLRNIERNPHVSLHLDGNGQGGDIVVAVGEARASEDPPPNEVPEYVEKYRGLMDRNGWSPDEFARLYPVPIRIALRRVRGH